MGEIESTFKAGDKVRHDSYGDGEITYGPLAGRSFISYVAVFDSGEHLAVHSSLTPRPEFSIGDRVTCDGHLAAVRSEIFTDTDDGERNVVVQFDSGAHMLAHVDAVEPLDDRHIWIEGVQYDLTAKYTDKDGDPWTLGRDDIGQAVAFEPGHRVAALSLRGLINNFGPLTRVEK